jgi:hypothetical protein
MSRLDLLDPYRRKDGHIGARAVVKIEREDGWHQSYQFDTHGMTSAQVVAKAAEFETYHHQKAERLNGFREIQGTEIGGYRVVDCSIHDNGVTLYLDVRPKVSGFPIRVRCATMDAVPSNEDIVKMITGALPVSQTEIADAHAEFVRKVNEKRGV